MTTKLMDGTVNLRIDLENFPDYSASELSDLITVFLASQCEVHPTATASVSANVVSSCLLRDK